MRVPTWRSVPQTAWFLLVCVICVVLSLPEHLAAASVKGYLLYPRDLEITGDNCSLPETLEIKLAIGRATLNLDLVRTGDLDPRAPIYSVLSSPSGGSVLQPLVLRTRSRYATYHDYNLPAAVILACAQSSHGIISMEGSVTHAGRVYRVRDIDESPRQGWTREPSRWLPARLTPLHLGLPYTTDYKHARRDRDRTYYISGDQEGSRDDTEGQAPPPRDQYYVDVLAVIDHAVFARWFARSHKASYADRVVHSVSNIVWNFALVFNEVNLRFQLITTLPYKINIRLVGYVISETPQGSAWMAGQAVGQDGYLNADTTLESFVSWVSSTDSLPFHDHAMLFSGYDLYRTDSDNTKKLHTTGLAYVGRGCSVGGESVSIIEEVGGYMIDWTVAHELAHSLGARHDGDGNWCSSVERYVMSTGEHPVTSHNQGNYWRFSSCSVEALHQFISETRRHAWGVVCLDQARPLREEGGEDGRPRGQRLNPDQQCQLLYGPKSRLLQRPLQGESANVCTALPCLDPQRSSGSHLYFYRHLAARGTSCGNKKWCVNGECVSSEDAPVRLENCVFGEEAGAVMYGRECWDYVSRSPEVCYQPLVASRCCMSCAEVRTSIPDCEYGDRMTCLRSKCGQGLTLQDGTPYDSSCCQTCYQAFSSTVPASPTVHITTTSFVTEALPDFSTDKPALDKLSKDQTLSDRGKSGSKDAQKEVPVTTVKRLNSTAKTRTKPDYVHRSAPAPTFQVPVTPETSTSTKKTVPTTTSARRPKAPDQDGCRDKKPPKGPPCPTLHHPETWHRCYNPAVANFCCSACHKLANPHHPGCEYGDRRPVACVINIRKTADCRKLSSICCHTCSHMTGSVSSSHKNLVFTPAVLILAVVSLLCAHFVS